MAKYTKQLNNESAQSLVAEANKAVHHLNWLLVSIESRRPSVMDSDFDYVSENAKKLNSKITAAKNEIEKLINDLLP